MSALRRSLSRWILAVAAVVAGDFAFSGGRVFAVDPPADGSGLQKSFDLKKQLETGLKARRPSDFAYIKTVVAKVENGTLPRDLVTEAFLYARAQNSQYPIVYFQFTLKKLAAKAGVVP